MATLLDLMTKAARRTNVNIGNSRNKDALRDYFNATSERICSMPVKWGFLYKTSTINITTSTSRGPYDLASDFLVPLSKFRDTVNDEVIPYSNFDDWDDLDPDEDETNDPIDAVILIGLNSSSGLYQAYVQPTPSSDRTLSYRYYALVPELDDTADDSSIDGYLPRVARMAWVHGMAAHYHQDKGQNDAAVNEFALMEARLEDLERLNIAQSTEQESSRMRRGDEGFGEALPDLLLVANAPS